MAAAKTGKNAEFLAKVGVGRKKGVLNKNTAALKDMILGALDKSGGVDYLVRQAEENPGPFMALVGKVLPMTVSGEGGGPIAITVITGVPRND